MTLKDKDAITLTDVQATAGDVEVTAGGKITATKVEASGNAKLTATTEGIKLGNVTATGGDVTVEALNGGDIEVNAGATVKSETAAVTLTADDNVTVNGTVDAKTTATAKATNGSVTLSDGSKVTADTKVVLDGKTGVTGGGTVDATGAQLDVDAAEGNIALTGTVLAKDAAFDAKDVSVYGGNNDFTGDVEATATAGSIEIRDANALTLKSAESAKDVRVVAGNALKTTGAVKGNENVLLKSTGGEVTLNGTATAGKNLTIASKGATTANKKVEAGEDLYVKAGGDIAVKAGAKAGQTMALVSGGKIDADSVAAKAFHSKDEKGTKIGTLSVESATFQTKGDFETKLAKDAKLAVSAGGNVTIDANGNSLEIGASSAAGGAALTVTEVLAESGTAEAELAGTGTGAGSATGLSAGKNATVKNAKNVKGTGVEAKSGDATVDATGVYAVDSTTAGGSVTLGKERNIGGNVTAGTISGNNSIKVKSNGSFNANTVKGGEVDIEIKGAVTADATSGGDIKVQAGGAAEFGSVSGNKVDVSAKDIRTTGGVITSKNLTLNGNGGNIDVKLKSEKIEKITGGNVTIEETASGEVSLGLLKANGNLSLTAKQAGFTDGNDNQSDFGELNLDVPNGDVTLVVGGAFGKPNNPMDAKFSKDSTLRIEGGDLSHENDPAFIHAIIRTERPDEVPEVVYDNPVGLVIVNNQIRGGNPKFIRKMNRALAFTVNTPELKSSQGVFGDAAFIHTGMDISEARSIGSVGALSLDVQDYHGIFDDLTAPGTGFSKMSPPILPAKSPLKDKIDQTETPASQPDVKNFLD